MSTCKTCKHWVFADPDGLYAANELARPSKPGNFEHVTEEEAVALCGHAVRQCTHPKIVFWERPAVDGAAVLDGSEYCALLITGEGFGCNLHEAA